MKREKRERKKCSINIRTICLSLSVSSVWRLLLERKNTMQTYGDVGEENERHAVRKRATRAEEMRE